jgi:transcriptional/translational regulatory protein YebC/TACO1
MWCNLWETWSVSWQFHHKWVFYINGTSKIEKIKWKDTKTIERININDFEEAILETDIEDYEIEEDIIKIITLKEDFAKVKKYLDNNNYNIENADIEYIPENFIILDETYSLKLEKLIDALEEDDDIDSIYHNAS